MNLKAKPKKDTIVREDKKIMKLYSLIKKYYTLRVLVDMWLTYLYEIIRTGSCQLC